MQEHRLKREIIATAVTNSTINRMGATFLLRMQEDSGRSTGEVARPSPSPARRWMRATCGRPSTGSTARSPSRVQVDALQVIWNLHGALHPLAAGAPARSPASPPRSRATTTGSATSARGKGILPPRSARLRGVAARLEGEGRAGDSAANSRRCQLPRAWCCDIIEAGARRKLKPSTSRRSTSASPRRCSVPWLQEQIDALPGGRPLARGRARRAARRTRRAPCAR